LLPLLLAAFFIGDPPPGAVEIGLLDAGEEAEHVETGGHVRVVHMFDITGVGSQSHTRPPTRGVAVDDADLLLVLGVAPATLDPAPDRRRGPDRVGLSPVPCSTCGQPACFTRVVDVPGRGLCWLDRCRPCFLATVALQSSRVPSITGGILADLRAAAAEARVPLTVLIDGEAG
jgi:hypothetical protein